MSPRFPHTWSRQWLTCHAPATHQAARRCLLQHGLTRSAHLLASVGGFQSSAALRRVLCAPYEWTRLPRHMLTSCSAHSGGGMHGVAGYRVLGLLLALPTLVGKSKAACIDRVAYVICGRSCAKHIDLKMHQAHQAHQDGDSVCKVDSKDYVCDRLTKALPELLVLCCVRKAVTEF